MRFGTNGLAPFKHIGLNFDTVTETGLNFMTKTRTENKIFETENIICKQKLHCILINPP